jgi:hypothetical protein
MNWQALFFVATIIDSPPAKRAAQPFDDIQRHPVKSAGKIGCRSLEI